MAVIYVLWLREVKRYLRSRAQIIASLGQPLLYLLVLGFGLGPVFAQAGRGSYLQFVAPGVVGMGILFTSIFSGIGLLWDRQFGFLKETLVAPVLRLQIMVGRTLGGATIAMVQGLLVLTSPPEQVAQPHACLRSHGRVLEQRDELLLRVDQGRLSAARHQLCDERAQRRQRRDFTRALIRARSVGDEVTMKVRRGSRELSVRMTLQGTTDE